MQDYLKLNVYKDAEKLVSFIYTLTKSFPSSEKYNIISQMKRAVTSICANIAEGTGRISNADFLRFLYHSMGSLKELHSFLRISTNLKYISQEKYNESMNKINSISKQLCCLIKCLKIPSTNH
jgi:four helix bundle protein